MEMKNGNLEELLERSIQLVDQSAGSYHYIQFIRESLYLSVFALLLKHGSIIENTLGNVLENTPVQFAKTTPSSFSIVPDSVVRLLETNIEEAHDTVMSTFVIPKGQKKITLSYFESFLYHIELQAMSYYDQSIIISGNNHTKDLLRIRHGLVLNYINACPFKEEETNEILKMGRCKYTILDTLFREKQHEETMKILIATVNKLPDKKYKWLSVVEQFRKERETIVPKEKSSSAKKMEYLYENSDFEALVEKNIYSLHYLEILKEFNEYVGEGLIGVIDNRLTNEVWRELASPFDALEKSLHSLNLKPITKVIDDPILDSLKGPLYEMVQEKADTVISVITDAYIRGSQKRKNRGDQGYSKKLK